VAGGADDRCLAEIRAVAPTIADSSTHCVNNSARVLAAHLHPPSVGGPDRQGDPAGAVQLLPRPSAPASDSRASTRNVPARRATTSVSPSLPRSMQPSPRTIVQYGV
jgi:hypothetical protein